MDDFKPIGQNVYDDDERPSGLIGQSGSMASFLRDYEVEETPTTTVIEKNSFAAPRADQVEYLKAYPDTASDFDGRFGPGAAAKALGTPKVVEDADKMQVVQSPITGLDVLARVGADDGVPAILDGYLTSQRLAEETTEDVARTNSLKAVWDQGASDKAASWIDGEVESAAKSVAALEADAKRGPITLDAQNRLDTARARLKAAQDVKADAAAGERQMTPKERVMMAMLIEAQSGVIDKAVRELQQFDSDPEYRKDLMARSASAGLDEARWNKDVREILAKRVNEAVRRRDLLRQALSQGRMRGAMTDATAIGEFVRSYARGIAQATGIMGGALNQWAESLEGEAGLGDALKSWSNKIIEDIPAEAAPELLKIQSARDVSLWFSSKLGQAFGTTLPIVASAIAAGPTAGVTAGLAMGQGEMRNTLEDALLAEGVEISKSEMQRIVMTYGTIIGGLDAIVPVLISRSGLRMILTTSAKRAAQVGIARQLAVAVARDSTIEGATEAAQEFLLEWGTADALDRGIDFEAFAPKAIEAFAAGFAGGVGFTTVGIPGEYSQIMRRRRDEALEAAEKIRTEIEAQTPAKPDAGDAGGGMAVPTEAPGTNEVVTSRPPSDPTAEAPKIPDRPKIIAKPRTPIPESKPVERPKAPDRPQTAIEYIRERGGIIDEGGDLAAMDAPRGVIADNGQGLSPDAMRESLVQAGYLPTPAEGEQEFTTADDVYDIVQRSLAGERVVAIGREADEATYQDYRKSGNLDEQSNEILNDLRDSLGEYGIAYDLTEIEEQRVVDLVRNEGLTPDDAFERNAIMRGSGAAEVRANEPGQADVPFPPMSGGRGVSQPGAVDIASRLPQLRAYLKGGGSLSRKAYRQIAQSTGVPQSQVREFLEAAEDAGIVKRDRRGAFRRDQVDDPNVVEIDVFDDLPSEDKEQPKSVSIDDFISDVERLKEKFGAPEKETIEAQDIEPINVDVKFAIGGGLTVKVTDAGPLLERIADDLRSFQSESNETLAVLERMQDVEIEGSSAEDLARLRTALVDLQKIVQDRLQASYALSDQIYTFENDLQTRFQDAVNRIESVEDRADTLTSEIVDLFDRIEGELESRGVDLNDESREKYDGSGQQLIAPYVDEDVDQSKTLIELFEEKAKSLEKSGASFDKIERLLSSEPDLEAMSIDELESMLDTLNEAQGALLTRLDVSRFYLKYYNEEGFDKIGERFDEIRKDIIEPATERLEDGADEIESFIADVDELASGSPQLASAAQTQNTMTRMVQSQLRSGKTVRISDRTIDRVRNALAPMLHHIPSDAQVAVIQTIKPSPLVKKTDRVDLEMLDLRTGESFSLVDVPFTVREIANVRAVHVPSGSA